MRKLTCFLLAGGCAASLAVTAAETWRWVDANGVTHYSDRPVPGAEKVQLQSAPKPGSVVTRAPERAPAEPPPAARRYTACRITAPAEDQVFNSVDAVAASVDVQPGLQDGHRLRLDLNGRTVDYWPETALGYMLTNLSRGSYSLAVQVLDESGEPVCNGPAVSFHVRQPSLLAPTSPQQNNAGGRTVPGVPGVPGVPRANTPR